MNPLKKTDPLLTQPKSRSLPCGKLHVRPSEMHYPTELTTVLRELSIHWSLEEGPDSVSGKLRNYADLLSNSNSLFRQVLMEMISEQQEQGGSHDM